MRTGLGIVAAVAALGCAGGAAAQAVEGQWRNPEGYVIRIEPCGDKLCGKGQVEADSQPILMLKEFSGSGATRTGGQLYSPKHDMWVNGELKLLAEDRLQVQGCVGVVCREQIWTRVR